MTTSAFSEPPGREHYQKSGLDAAIAYAMVELPDATRRVRERRLRRLSLFAGGAGPFEGPELVVALPLAGDFVKGDGGRD